jgi:ComF family protein
VNAIALPGRIAGRLIALALPPRCPGCGTVTLADHLFCPPCWQKLDFLGGPCCPRCGDPCDLDPGPEGRCTACVADPPAFDSARAAVAYGDIARALVLRLKHGRRPGVAETIARRLDRLVEDGAGQLVVPVPLHRWRLWARGYNQAALIGRALARRRGLAFAPTLLRRTKATPMLRGMGREARAHTVRAALEGVRIVLIDDVYTTGATAHACARALKRAGAAEVRLVCWARVLRIDN